MHVGNIRIAMVVVIMTAVPVNCRTGSYPVKMTMPVVEGRIAFHYMGMTSYVLRRAGSSGIPVVVSVRYRSCPVVIMVMMIVFHLTHPCLFYEAG